MNNKITSTIKEDHIYHVIKYILEKEGEMTAMKLHKLLYYVQAWSLVWDEKPMFTQRIEAWANGPVIPDIYKKHKGIFKIDKSADWVSRGDSNKLTEEQKETIDAVLKFYASKDSYYLSRLTHIEDPWKNARKGIPMGERSNVEIIPANMAEYYSGL